MEERAVADAKLWMYKICKKKTSKYSLSCNKYCTH